MNNISFNDIYYPLMSDPRNAMLHAIRRPLQDMLYYAKKHKNGEGEYSWEHMHEYYNQLIGVVHALRDVGMLENGDMFRIPFIAYRTALKIACSMPETPAPPLTDEELETIEALKEDGTLYNGNDVEPW